MATSSGSAFDFDAWIEDNDLTDIKSLFKNQNMRTLSALSMQSPQFSSLMTSVSSSGDGNVFIPKICKALQALTDNNKPPGLAKLISIYFFHFISIVSVIKKRRIIATEQEIAVEESIKNRLKNWSAMNQRIKRIQHQFAIRKNKKHTVEQQIQSNFQTLSDDAKQQKIRMMHELSRFEQHLDSKLNILSSLRTEIETEKLYQNNKLNEAGRFLEDNEIGRKERKMSILNIGNETEYRFNTRHAKFEGILSEQVTNESNVNYGFKLDDKSFNKCIKYLHKYGA